MSRLSALLFPETIPAMQSVATLLHFFDAAAYYLPAEADDRQAATEQQLLHGLCTGYAPAPLGSDLDRFNRLIRELQTYRPEDITRLISFAKAEITTGQIRDQDESSAGTLLAALHKSPHSSISELQVERLWQARLVLKLAEILDEKETEIRNGLAAVSSIEQKLYGSLQGTDVQVPDELESMAGSDAGASTQHAKDQAVSQADLLIPIRVKAWAELFLTDSLRKPGCFLATSHKGAAALLIDGCENVFHKQPVKLLSLLLPAAPLLGGDDEATEVFFNRRIGMQKEVIDCLAAIDDFLLETAGLSGVGPDAIIVPVNLDKKIQTWNAAVLSNFPGSTQNSNILNFYCFAAVSMEQLFQRVFHLEAPETTGTTGHPTTIIAVLNA